jgi:hypothetical protein
MAIISPKPKGRKSQTFSRPTRLDLQAQLRSQIPLLLDTALKEAERPLQTLAQTDLRFPSEQRPRFGYIGTAARRVVLWKRLEEDIDLRSGDGEDLLRALENRPLHRVADVNWERLA